MKLELRNLLQSINTSHPLYQVSVKLLSDWDEQSEAALLDGESDLANFERIYRRRFEHLNNEGYESYGIPETMSHMTRHMGKARICSLDTKSFKGYCFTDVAIKNIVGLVIVRK